MRKTKFIAKFLLQYRERPKYLRCSTLRCAIIEHAGVKLISNRLSTRRVASYSLAPHLTCLENRASEIPMLYNIHLVPVPLIPKFIKRDDRYPVSNIFFLLFDCYSLLSKGPFVCSSNLKIHPAIRASKAEPASPATVVKISNSLKSHAKH